MRTAASSLLLVRNSVEHDARVLRAARVAERTLGGRALIVGVATAQAPSGETTVEGIAVRRLGTQIARRRVRTPSPRAQPSSSPSPSPDPPTQRGSARLSPRARIGRILAGAIYSWRALRLARRVRPRLVHANDWNTMWCAVAIKLLCGARLVYDSHELWPDRNGRWEWRPWLLASEALFVRAADIVITASPGYAEVLAHRYRIARPAVIRNIPEMGEAVRDAAAANQHVFPSVRPTLVYIGGLMPGRGLEETIDALALAPDARLRAIGPGADAYRTTLTARAAAIGVADRVELVPAVAPTAVASALADASAGLCLIQPVCRSYELTLPNKLFEYAAAGVPVLASDLPVIAQVVREADLGEVVAPGDPAAIAAGLMRLCEPERGARTRGRARAFAQDNSWSAEAQRLAGAYRRLASAYV